MGSNQTAEHISHDRRRLLGTATMGIAVAGAASLLPGKLRATVEDNAIRSLRVNFPEADLVELQAAFRSPRQSI